eukprot:757357-Hanusia_phi.AAC.1
MIVDWSLRRGSNSRQAEGAVQRNLTVGSEPPHIIEPSDPTVFHRPYDDHQVTASGSSESAMSLGGSRRIRSDGLHPIRPASQ